MQSDLTAKQQKSLAWIASNDHHRARWMRDGKGAFGSPETWDAFEIAGHKKSIRISKADWQAIGPHIIGSDKPNRMFEVAPTSPQGERK